MGDDGGGSMRFPPTVEGSAGRLRIAYVYRHFNRNGSLESLYVRQAERLAADEEVTAFCSAVNRVPTSQPIRFADVEPMLRGGSRFRYAVECASFARRATRALSKRRDDFDVVHVEGTAALTADLVTVHAVRPAEIEHYFANVDPQPRARQLGAYVVRPQSSVVIAIERRLFAGRPFCIAPTHQIKDDLGRVYGLPGELVDVIHYPIEIENLPDEQAVRVRLRRERGTPENRLVVLFVGEDFARKGLAEAIESIAKSTSDAELWVVGGGPAARYRELAGRLGVADRIYFLGRSSADEVRSLYAASDVVVLPSRQDAWGMTVVEAMAARRVAVASMYAGSHEAIDDGVTGYVVANEGIAERIAALLDGPLSDRERRSQVGERAVAAAAQFRFDAIYPRLRDAHHRAHELRRSREATGRRQAS